MHNNIPDEHTQATKEALDKYFKGAVKGRVAEENIYQQLKRLGFTAENTLFTDSSCPDEINHDDPDEDITSLLAKRWGEVFPLSGLGGLPFTGKTGWAAFSSHVPTPDGNIVILFAPHVGIDREGNVGKIHREGIEQVSSACGAAIGALTALKKDPSEGDMKNGYLDNQMDIIKHLLRSKVDEISKAPNE